MYTKIRTKKEEAMMTRNARSRVVDCALVVVFAVFIGAPSFCFAQTSPKDAGSNKASAGVDEASSTSSKADAGSAKASANPDDPNGTSSVPDNGAGNPATPDPRNGGPTPGQTTSKSGPVPSSGFTGRFDEFARNAPIRESFVTVNLAGKYIK